MKKHFLLLVMAFMSVTAWAYNLDPDKFGGAPNIAYVTSQLPQVVEDAQYAAQGIYEIDYTHFYTSSTGDGETLVVTPASGETPARNNLEKTVPGEYFIKVIGKGTYSGSNLYISFRIYPSIIELDFNANQGKTYGDAAAETYGYTAKLNNTVVENDALAALITRSGLTVGRADKTNNNRGTYAFTYSVTDANYQVMRANGDNDVYTIAPKPANNLTVALTLATTAPKYTGAAQTPTFTVKDGTTDLPTDQFTLSYAPCNAQGEVALNTDYAPTAVNAGYYKVKATAKDGGNYTGNADAAEIFQIAQAPLNVYINPLEKTYTAAEAVITDAVIGFSGLQGTDAQKAYPLSTSTTAPAYEVVFDDGNVQNATHINAGTYNLKIQATNNLDNAAVANYAITPLGGVLTVSSKAITVKAKDATKQFGAQDPDFEVDATEAFQADRATVASAYEVTRPGKGTDEAASEDPYVGALKIAKKTGELPAGTVTTLKNYAITLADGDFTITAGTLMVYPKAVVTTYGTVLTAEDFDVIATTATGSPVTLTTKPTVIVKGYEAGKYPKNVGTYVLELQGTAAAEGYTAANITTLDGQLNIRKKALNFTLASQALANGATETTLNANNATNVTANGKVEGDVIGFKLEFNVGNEQGQLDAGYVTAATETTPAKLADGANNQIFAKGIKIVEVEATETAPNDNANYEITWTATGKLIVGTGNAEDSEIVFEDSNNDLAAAIANVAGETYGHVKITFAARNAHRGYSATATETYPWIAEKWTTMVLPFDISVADLSKALDYAIVNVINPEKSVVSGTGSKFYGMLTMKGGNGKDDVLAANKPFMLKLAGDINPTKQYDFGKRTIVAPSALSVDADADKTVKFTGTYTAKTVTKADNAAIWFMNGNEDGWQYIGASSSSSWTIAPFEAFIDMSAAPAAARNMTFYFEEKDGSVTAIKGVSVDSRNTNMNAEGWYNLNGVKLPGAPTKKGIYIQNGKKVVIR